MAEQRSGGGRPISASQRPTGGDKAIAGKKQYFRRKKLCRFCVEKIDDINYKDVRMLNSFISERGKITPRRISGVCAPASAAAGGSHQAGAEYRADAVCDVDFKDAESWKSFYGKISTSSANAARW